MKARIWSLLAIVAVILNVTSCRQQTYGADDKSRIHVGIVFDTGGKDDRSFNAAAWEGVHRAAKDMPLVLRDVEPGDPTSIEPAMRAFAERDYDLIIGVGFSQTPLIEAVAKDYPKISFAVVDGVSQLPNVASLIFREHEGAYLVGMIAAQTTKTGTIGFIGGMDIPLIHKFVVGYEEGAKAVNPKITVIPNYIGVTDAAWNDPVKGKELARTQLEKGADVLFAAAGNSGLGAFDAVEQFGKDEQGRAKKFVIGVDSNQNWVKPGFVLTSMVKRVDNAVYQIVQDRVNKRPVGGIHVYGLDNGGISYALDQYNQELIPAAAIQAVDNAKRRIIAGEIKVTNAMEKVKSTMLELRNITKRFGGVLANDHVNIAVKTGAIHAIVGENGAGKSTAMKIAYGFYTPDEGEIVVDGIHWLIRTPHDAILLGVGMVHQHFMLVGPMTVTENIVLGAEPGSFSALDLTGAEKQIRALSEEFHLAIDPGAVVETLSVGQQQRVELLKALYRRARILILDEPTAVLTPLEVEEFFLILRRMREQGKTVIIITHKLDEVLAISDDVTVMRDGRVLGTRKTNETNAAELARLMVGRDVLLRIEKSESHPGAVVLKISELSMTGQDGTRRLDKISLEVRAGEIVGIAGVEGNGQTELIEDLAGLVEPTRLTGVVEFQGQNISALNARDRKEKGVAHVPEDRHRRGLLLDSDLSENSILGVHYRQPAVSHAHGVMLDEAGIRRRTQDVIREYDVRPANPDLPARSLSGGNQQKLIIGREFGLPPKLLLISQPTRGVDIGAIEFIHRKLVALRDGGCAILLVSAELEEVTALADRLLVIYQGRIVGEVDPRRATKADIGSMMTGGSAK